MSRSKKLMFGHRGQHSLRYCHDHPETVKRRFRHIKQDIEQRSDFEITNAFVLSVLFDLFWLHREAEEPGAEVTLDD